MEDVPERPTGPAGDHAVRRARSVDPDTFRHLFRDRGTFWCTGHPAVYGHRFHRHRPELRRIPARSHARREWCRTPASRRPDVDLDGRGRSKSTVGEEDVRLEFRLCPECVRAHHVAAVRLDRLVGDDMTVLKRYRFFLVLLSILLLVICIDQAVGLEAIRLTGRSMLDMIVLLPPIFVLVGLLDQWVPKELLIRYMGSDSGLTGILFTLVLATIAAGPLYIAFPIAVLLLRKGAGVRYVVFFLGAWSTVKLPVLVYEFTSFGLPFTSIHIGFGLLFYYVTGILFERYYDRQQLLQHDQTER